MRKALFTLMCLFAMMAAGTGLKAQEITITLEPGWNWISYPNAEVMDVASALGGFAPVEGDQIKSRYTTSRYTRGRWGGGVTQLMPGWGYMYYSARSETVEFSFAQFSSTSLATSTPTDITLTSAVVGGTVTLPEGSQVFLRGVCWGTEPRPDIDGDHTTEETGIGSFSNTLEDLTPNTTYYVRAYVIYDHGLAYGNELSFTTLSGIPVVTTAEVTDVTATTATCGGMVTDDGGLDITARGVCWSTSSNPTIVDAHSTDGTGTGNFSSTLTGLTPNTTYFVRAYATNSYVTVYGNQRSFTTAPLPSCTVSVTCNPTEGGTITGGGTYEQGQSCTLTATANEGYTFTNWTENDEVVSTDATYSFTVETDRALVANFAVSSGGDHAYVDLGLPSGLLWATCNVGADNPEDYGDYFAWGETQPKDYYNWSTYQYCNGNYNTLTKYCNDSYNGYNGFTDNLTTLLPEDDAATANWGSDWRMPTKEEWQELYNNTTHTWTTQNGVDGRLFTASNGNSLFLPAAGYRYNSYLSNAGLTGYYRSSSLYPNDPNDAWYFHFNSDRYYMDYYNRSYGRSVRAVRVGSQTTSFSIDATTNPSEGGTVAGTGNYAEGITCTLTATANEGYTFTNWTENGEVVSTNATYSFTVNADRTLVANFIQSGSGGDAPTGAIDGKFTINADGDQVYFSQGNLQYIGSAATPYWKFADNQWDVLNTATGQNSSSQNVDRDLFGWGTSGYNHGADCYQPWSTSQSNSDYHAYGSPQYNLYDQTGQADWGYNPISNGGNQANQWRTLTEPEWAYIFNTRTTSSGIRYAKATVNDVNGVILLPDDWSSDTYSLVSINYDNGSYYRNTISATQWSTLEQAGAVFLPAAGYRGGTSVYNVGSDGCYWSASYSNDNHAYHLLFSYGMLDPSYSSGSYRSGGRSVRLVAPAEN